MLEYRKFSISRFCEIRNVRLNLPFPFIFCLRCRWLHLFQYRCYGGGIRWLMFLASALGMFMNMRPTIMSYVKEFPHSLISYWLLL